jgi:hypothetical protein
MCLYHVRLVAPLLQSLFIEFLQNWTLGEKNKLMPNLLRQIKSAFSFMNYRIPGGREDEPQDPDGQLPELSGQVCPVLA